MIEVHIIMIITVVIDKNVDISTLSLLWHQNLLVHGINWFNDQLYMFCDCGFSTINAACFFVWPTDFQNPMIYADNIGLKPMLYRTLLNVLFYLENEKNLSTKSTLFILRNFLFYRHHY